MQTSFSEEKVFFNLQPLTKMTEMAVMANKEEVEEIYLVLKGGVTITNQQSRVLLKHNNLYWSGYDQDQRFRVDQGTEGYAIRFSKSLLKGDRQDFFCSYLAAFQSTLLKNEIIQIGDSFSNEAMGLCELMRQEFEGKSFFKMQVLSGILSLFLLHLIRKSNVLLYISSNEKKDL